MLLIFGSVLDNRPPKRLTDQLSRDCLMSASECVTMYRNWNLSGHHSLFSVHTLFPQVFGAFIHGFFLQRERQIHTITLVFTIHKSRVNVITRMYIHYSRRMVLANALPFTSVGDYQHRRKSLKTNRQTHPTNGRRMMMRSKGFIPITNHANDHYSLSFVHNEWFTNHTNHIHTFTPITGIVPTKIGTLDHMSWARNSTFLARDVSIPETKVVVPKAMANKALNCFALQL